MGCSRHGWQGCCILYAHRFLWVCGHKRQGWQDVPAGTSTVIGGYPQNVGMFGRTWVNLCVRASNGAAHSQAVRLSR